MPPLMIAVTSLAAAYYEAHADDYEKTSDPIEPPEKAERRGVGTIITVRFSAAEAAALRRVAEAEGRSHSDVIRRAVRRYAAGSPGDERATTTITVRCAELGREAAANLGAHLARGAPGTDPGI